MFGRLRIVLLLLALGNDRRHGRHTGGPEQKSFPPLGANFFFSSKFCEKIFFKLSSSMAALSRCSKTEINSMWTKITYYLVKNKQINSNHALFVRYGEKRLDATTEKVENLMVIACAPQSCFLSRHEYSYGKL